MKSTYITLALALISTMVLGQSKKVVQDSITVYGNCIQCKNRIESALEIKGVKVADWNMKTKKLFIAYRPDKISEDELHKVIAGVGHDTDNVQAIDSVYSKLDFCCLFRQHDPHTPEDHAREKKGSKRH